MDKGATSRKGDKSAKGWNDKGRNGNKSARSGQRVEGQGPPTGPRGVGPAECVGPVGAGGHKKRKV